MAAYQSEEDLNERIDEFFERTKEMEGDEVVESPPWNTRVNPDQSKGFLNGIGDVNPRWHPEGPGEEVHPAYLTSVMYPMLHGEPMEVPLSSLIAGVEYEWFEPITIGDRIDATPRVKEVFEKGDPEAKRYVFIISEIEYARDGEVIATAEGTMIRATQRETELLEERDVPEYTDEDRDEIRAAYESEMARLESIPETPTFGDLEGGDALPEIVRGPLSIADMVCWNAGRGPTYGAHLMNYRERKDAPHNTVVNPKTGWLQKTSHQHEDVWMCEQRGMPLPFANGVNMYALSTSVVTNWMGGETHLRRHAGNLQKPYYYGEVLWFDGEIDTVESDRTVEVAWEARNQDDEVVMDGDSTIEFPDGR